MIFAKILRDTRESRAVNYRTAVGSPVAFKQIMPPNVAPPSGNDVLVLLAV